VPSCRWYVEAVLVEPAGDGTCAALVSSRPPEISYSGGTRRRRAGCFAKSSSVRGGRRWKTARAAFQFSFYTAPKALMRP
jgi:hypothetical protein